MVLWINKVYGGGALFSAVSDPGGQVSRPERRTDTRSKARTILKRFISARRTPAGTIDHTENGKLN